MLIPAERGAARARVAGALRGTRPGSFAVVMATGIVSAALHATGRPHLSGAALVPGRLAVRRREPPAITDISGNWYLWAVGTQSLAIAATFVAAGGLIRTRPGALVAIITWSAGALVYLVITVLVAIRLAAAGLGRPNPTAPYWVAMGAASITVLAAAQILRGSGPAALGAARPVLTAAAVIFWAAASGLIPLLIARSAWRHLGWREPLRYRADLWMIVFPAGMYATASMQLGSAARLPLIHGVGTLAVWPAAAAWALTLAAMTAPLARRPPAPRPGNLYRDTIGATGLRQAHGTLSQVVLVR
jgi:tellurite resistance protein TehA-like permease